MSATSFKYPTLSAEQAAALIRFANEHGANWKSKLVRLWETGSDPRIADAGLLRQIRNSFGPVWLYRNFSLSECKLQFQQPRRPAQTNTELVVDLMEQSTYGALAQAFVIEALSSYANCVIEDAGINQEANSIIPPGVWKGIAEEFVAKISARNI